MDASEMNAAAQTEFVSASSTRKPSSMRFPDPITDPIKRALWIVDTVISLSDGIRINLHQCKRLVDFYKRAKSYLNELGRFKLFTKRKLYDDAIDALDKGRCLINGYVEANWLESIQNAGVNRDAFARTHVELEDSFRAICENVEAGARLVDYLSREGLYLLLEFDTLAPLYFLDDEYRATLFERDAQMDKKHMLETITGLGDQWRERIESMTITTKELRATLNREQGVVAEALLENKKAKVRLVQNLIKGRIEAESSIAREADAARRANEQLLTLRNDRSAPSSSRATELPQDFKIQFSEIQIGPRIGSGGFATVRKCQWQNHHYALKIFESTDVEGLRAEVQNLVLLPRHPNVVLLVGFSIQKTNGSPMLLMELLDGDLQTLTCKEELAIETKKPRLIDRISRLFGRDTELSSRDTDLSTPIKIDFIHQIAKGMLFLHNRKVFHGDLKAKNVLVKQRPGDSIQLKITDFGLSERLMFKRNENNSDEDLNCSHHSDESLLGVRYIIEEGNVQRVVVGNVGTVRWMAPEVYGGSRSTDLKPYSMKADVFSFAMTCVEILTGQHPFPHIFATKHVKAHVESGKRPNLSTLEKDFPQALLNLVKRCWNADPSSRPDFSQIYSSMQELKKAYPIK